MSEQQSRVLTLVFTDLVDSTALKATHGDQTVGNWISRHRELVTQFAAQESGTIVDWAGDGCFLYFEAPSSAVLFGLQLQQAHHEEKDLPGVRVGVHMGEVSVSGEPQAPRVEGLSVDLAARIESLAIPGQVLMSSTVFNSVRQRLHGDALGAKITWMAHGAYELKGFGEPMELCEAGMEGTSPLTPPQGSEKAHRAVSPAEEETLGWRPAVGLHVPRRDNWVLEEQLGEGGYGEVWLALHEKTKAKRVFKFCYEPDRVRGLKREVVLFRLLKESLGHRDDIAQIVDWEFERAPYYLESEYTEGGDLKDWADAKGGLAQIPLETRLELVAQVAVALGAAHSVGVLHKDIKPTNILISEVAGRDVPRASLTDFGIGLITDPTALAAQGITAAGLTETLVASSTPSTGAGTRLYMAPEIVEGKPATTLSDIYSLGVVLYQLAIGDLAHAVAPGWERGIEDDLLREDIAACVDGDPEQRLKSADQLAERLRTLGDRRAAIEAEKQARIEAEQNRLAAESAKRRRRQFTVMTALGMSLTVIVALLAVREFNLRNSEQEARVNAETAREEAERLRTEAEVARDESDRLRRAAFERNYISDVRLAANYLEQDNVESAKTILRSASPEYRGWEWGHLVNKAWPPASSDRAIRQFPDGTSAMDRWLDSEVKLITTLVGHGGPVYSVDISPDEKQVITASVDQTVRQWQLPEGKLIRTYQNEAGNPSCAFSPNGQYIAMAHSRLGSALFDARTGEKVQEFVGHSEPISNVGFGIGRPILISNSLDNTYRVWDLDSGEELSRYNVEDASESMFIFRHVPDSSRIYLADKDNTIVEWDYESNEVLNTFGGPAPERLKSGMVDPDFARAISWEPTANSSVVWNLETGLEIFFMSLGGSNVTSPMVFTPDGSGYFLRSSDFIGLTEGLGMLNSVQLGIVSNIQTNWPGSISREGNLVAIPDVDGTVRIVGPAVKGSMSETVLSGHGDLVYHAEFNKAATKLYTSSFDGAIREWDLLNGNASRMIVQHDGEITVMRLSPDERYMYTYGYDNMNRLTEVATGKVLYSVPSKMPASFAGNVRGPVVRLASAMLHKHAFSPDGSKVAFQVSGEANPIIDLETGRDVYSLGGHGGFVYLIQFSPDGKYVATLGYQETFINLWDAETGEFRHRLGLDSGQLIYMRFHPDSDRIATTHSSGVVTLWSVDDGAKIFEKDLHSGTAMHVEFSSDGKRLVSSGSDTDIVIVDAETGDSLTKLIDHTAVVIGTDFSPDGQRLLSMSNDNTARVWDRSGRLLHTLRLPEGVLLYYAAWSPDGRTIVTCAGDGTAKLWRSVDWTQLDMSVDTNDAFTEEIQRVRSGVN